MATGNLVIRNGHTVILNYKTCFIFTVFTSLNLSIPNLNTGSVLKYRIRSET